MTVDCSTYTPVVNMVCLSSYSKPSTASDNTAKVGNIDFYISESTDNSTTLAPGFGKFMNKVETKRLIDEEKKKSSAVYRLKQSLRIKSKSPLEELVFYEDKKRKQSKSNITSQNNGITVGDTHNKANNNNFKAEIANPSLNNLLYDQQSASTASLSINARFLATTDYNTNPDAGNFNLQNMNAIEGVGNKCGALKRIKSIFHKKNCNTVEEQVFHEKDNDSKLKNGLKSFSILKNSTGNIKSNKSNQNDSKNTKTNSYNTAQGPFEGKFCSLTFNNDNISLSVDDQTDNKAADNSNQFHQSETMESLAIKPHAQALRCSDPHFNVSSLNDSEFSNNKICNEDTGDVLFSVLRINELCNLDVLAEKKDKALSPSTEKL